MPSLHHGRLRRAELQCIRPLFAKNSCVLELGGGNGYQASILESWGCRVISLDIAVRASVPMHHPVCVYDGVRIPTDCDQFDIIFSSNVLEHVEQLQALTQDMHRVLKPGGVAIHVLPTASWRLWTSLTHYPHLAKSLLTRPLDGGAATGKQQANEALGKYGALGFIRRILFAPPHGTHASALGELYYFSKKYWVRLFTRNGFHIIQTMSTEIYYSGNELIPAVPVETRRRLSRLMGSSTCVFVMGHRKDPGHVNTAAPALGSGLMHSFRRTVKALRWGLFGLPWQRRRVRHECARIAASLFGDFPLSDDYKLWREDKEFIRIFRELSPENYYSEDRKYTLRELVRFTRQVPGSMAECGSYRGASAWFIASVMPEVPLYLFDSFEGLPEPVAVDAPADDGSQNWQKGDFSCSIDNIRNNLGEYDNITILDGWIPARFQEVAGERFRFVHIDVDLYQPTRDALEFFYPRLNPGGVICMDDYGSTNSPGAHAAAEEFFKDKPEYILCLTTGQGVVIKTVATDHAGD